MQYTNVCVCVNMCVCMIKTTQIIRWKRDEFDEKIKNPDTGKNILQFVCILRRDGGGWAIPGVSTISSIDTMSISPLILLRG